MKICILAPRYPFPENGGDALRINSIARYLKSRGHELILVSFCETENKKIEKQAKELYNHIFIKKRYRCLSAVYSFLYLLCGKPIQCGYYHSVGYKRLLKEVVKKYNPDLFIAHLLRMVPYLESTGFSNRSIVEMTDVLSKTYSLSSKAKGSKLKKILYTLEKERIANYERHVVNIFPKVVLVSSEDINIISTSQTANVKLHSNGVNIYPHPSKTYNRNKICFIGNMRTLQNQDAVIFFVNEVFPKILEGNRNAIFYIVGAEPPQKIKSLASNHVVVTGFVENLSNAIKDSCVAVAPVRIAAGIQNKVLESMAHGLPVILTSIISKAIPELENGMNCIIEDDAGKMAKVCIDLMNNSELRGSIAQKGYSMVKHSYSWKCKLDGYEVIAI